MSDVATPGSLTVLVPAYQEESGIGALVSALAAFRKSVATRDIHLVVVDDGSTDATPKLLAEHLEGLDWASVATHPTNRGITAALATGLDRCETDYVAWFDSDLTYEPALLESLAAELDSGADVALASCYHPDGGIEGVPAWRLALSRAASSAYRLVTRRPIHTFTSMVRAYRREVLTACQPRRGGFLGVTEVLLRALRAGHRCVEVPAILARRRTGQSKMRILRVAMGHFGLISAWILGGPR